MLRSSQATGHNFLFPSARLPSIHRDAAWFFKTVEGMPVAAAKSEARLAVVEVWTGLTFKAGTFNGFHVAAIAPNT